MWGQAVTGRPNQSTPQLDYKNTESGGQRDGGATT